jgi:hypothetical protein
MKVAIVRSIGVAFGDTWYVLGDVTPTKTPTPTPTKTPTPTPVSNITFSPTSLTFDAAGN